MPSTAPASPLESLSSTKTEEQIGRALSREMRIHWNRRMSYSEASAEAALRRREAKRKVKLPLDPEARAALGRVSPELAWLQLRLQMAGAIEEHPKESFHLAETANWEASLPELQSMMESL